MTPWTVAHQALLSTRVLQARILEWVATPSPGIFLTQGWNPDLRYCRQILYQLRHKGSPRILEWVAYPFSRAGKDDDAKRCTWAGGMQEVRRVGVTCSCEALDPRMWGGAPF